MTKEPRKKKSLSTQELLSMNMDRLKEYMKKWGADPKDAPVVDSLAGKRKSQRLTVRRPGRNVLAVMHDPMALAQINNANDGQPSVVRCTLTRAQSFAVAMEKILESSVDLLILDDEEEEAEEGRITVSGFDALLVLKGVMPKGDKMFLLRKQGFVKDFVPGDSETEKLASFRVLKRDCASMPIIYLTQDIDSKHAAIASRLKNVKSVAAEPPGFETLFVKLGEVLT